jgi:hypothetical protein
VRETEALPPTQTYDWDGAWKTPNVIIRNGTSAGIINQTTGQFVPYQAGHTMMVSLGGG